MDIELNLRRAAEAIGGADALLVTAGAGIGVDSGLPDFRGDKGFWKAYPAVAKLGLSFVEMANPEWFQRDPRLAWAFYGHRLNLYRNTSPHSGFHTLLELARRKPGGYFVFTSNVDGQFQKAGFDDGRIVECHGSIHWFQCLRECSDLIWDAEGVELNVEEESFKALDPLPKCPKCGKPARPNILMFGDWQWNSRRTDAQSAGLRQWLNRVSEKGWSFAVIETGAGRAVSTVRHTSENIAARCGGTLVRINPRDFDVPGERHVSIPLGALEGISRIGGIVEV
jgi:NAD-dependent SIR2 family protein deacetylase